MNLNIDWSFFTWELFSNFVIKGLYFSLVLTVIATVGEVTPSIIVILIVAAMLAKFRESRLVSNALYGLRPASSGLIAAACIDVALQVLLHIGSTTADGALLKEFASFGSRNWRGLVLAAPAGRAPRRLSDRRERVIGERGPR